MIDPLETAVLAVFRELARMMPRFLAYFREDLRLDPSFKKLSTYADHGVEFIASLSLSFLRSRLANATLSLGALLPFANSLARYEIDVVPRFVTEKFRANKLLADLFTSLKCELSEKLVVGIKQELETAFRAFTSTNFKKTSSSAKPTCFNSLVAQLKSATAALIRPDNANLLLQLTGTADHSITDLTWKMLTSTAVKCFTVVDLKNLTAELSQVTAVLHSFHSAAGSKATLYHEEVHQFCSVFLRGDLRTISDSRALTAQLPQSDLQVVKAVLRKFEEIRPTDVPFVAEKEVKRVIALIT